MPEIYASIVKALQKKGWVPDSDKGTPWDAYRTHKRFYNKEGFILYYGKEAPFATFIRDTYTIDVLTKKEVLRFLGEFLLDEKSARELKKRGLSKPPQTSFVLFDLLSIIREVEEKTGDSL